MPASTIWTIGHSTRSADEFVSLLEAHGITGLGDIRTIPASRRHPQFGGDALAARLGAQSIEYRHFPGLGGLRKPAKNSGNSGWKNASFRGYADHMQTPAFGAAVNELLDFGAGRRVAVMCAEAVWWQCHRMLLSDALTARGVEVQHIMGERGPSALQPHRMTAFARVESAAVSYPGLI